MKTLITLILGMAVSIQAAAQQNLSVMASNEANEPTRLQHSFAIEGDTLALRGFSNLDLSSHSDLNRYQIKPRLAYTVAEAEPVRVQAVAQQEWFRADISYPTPKGIGNKTVQTQALRSGVGLVTQALGISSEFNLYLHDSQTGGARLEMFNSVRVVERWSISNQFWRDFSVATSFNQASVQWRATPAVSMVLQHNAFTGKIPVYRVGVCVTF